MAETAFKFMAVILIGSTGQILASFPAVEFLGV